MNPFRMEASGKIIPKMKGNKNDMALYNYLRDCRYQVAGLILSLIKIIPSADPIGMKKNI